MIYKRKCPKCSYEQYFSTDLSENEAFEKMDKKCRICKTFFIDPNIKKTKKMIRRKK